MKIYSYGKQSISQRDINAVVDALNSDSLTQGALIQEFEKNISKYTDAKYCVALSSATAALHLSMIALKIGEDDEVITSPNTFVASANCARYVEASVRFADIDPETANISVCEIKKQITSKTKAIIPVHFAGQSCDMEAVHDLAQERGLYVVEDAAHAFGSDYKNKKVGSCTYSDMTIFSFHPVKTITTGEGGAVTTNNKELYEKVLLLRSHGIEKKSSMIETHGKWYYEMHQLGFNYRMTEIQAALGISQLKKVEQFKEKRRYIISLYKKLFSEDSRIAFLEEKEYSNACFHLCPVLIDFEKLKIDKKKFIDGLFDVGLRLQIHYIPVHWQPYYQKLGFSRGEYPAAEKYYAQTISLPLYPDLSDDDVDYIAKTFLTALDNV